MKRQSLTVPFLVLLLLAAVWCVADFLLGLTEPSPPTVTVPALIGESERAAEDYPFLEITATYLYNEAPAGTVLEQEPAAGSTRRLSERHPIRMTLTVSLGPKTVEIPALVGTDAREAVGALRALGFAVEEIRLPGGIAGAVERTEPRAGETATTGSTVRVWIYAGESVRTVAVPNVLGLSRGEALLTLFRAGLAVEGEAAPPAGATELVVTGQAPAADSVVTAGSRVQLTFGTPSGAKAEPDAAE